LNAVIATAKLIAFRRINAPEADARPVNFYRVAVDYAGLPVRLSANAGKAQRLIAAKSNRAIVNIGNGIDTS
jgi:hypothetical protein